ncbi:MAG: glycosyltransferase [Phycisphaerae bacterium]|nr:glycosyltransferase [Phycisphaerae bacterium]
MRIVVVTSLYPNSMQPHLAQFNRQQFAALARAHNVQIIAPVAWTNEWLHAGHALERRDVRDDVTVQHPRYLFTPKLMRGWYGHFFVRSIGSAFREAVRTLRPNVVLGCWAYPDGWAAVHLAREAGLPVVIKVHGSDLLTLTRASARMRRTTEALAGADAVVAVSRHLRDRAIALGAAAPRTHVVGNGVDTSLFCPGGRSAARADCGIVSNKPLLLAVGNLVPVKGHDVLIDALARLSAQRVPFQCVIVGDGPQRDPLQTRIRALGLSDRVRLVGALPLAQLPTWYRAADLMVLPSRSEGVPNVLLEATACGTPWIATAVGGVPEIAHAGALVPAGDSPALCERIAAFIRSGAAPAPIVGPCTWDASAAALAAVLHDAATNHSNLCRQAA